MKELRCPKCGSIEIIERDNGYDMDDCNNVAVFHYRGYCLDCETYLAWDKIYTFDRYDAIKIDE